MQEIEKEPTKRKIEVVEGTREGKWFTQWRFDELYRLVDEMLYHEMDIQNCKMWYFRDEDYHILEFDLNGEKFKIYYYKIYRVEKNGETWANRNNISEVALYIKRLFTGKTKREWHF